MFTGIVQAVGRIHSAQTHPFGAKLSVESQGWSQRHESGDSIAVAGCCLTLTDQQGQVLMFDVIDQTLRRTTLGDREPGDRVNLESALKPQTPIGGHFVQGHIDAIGTVAALIQNEKEARVRLTVEREVLPYLTPTGGVAIEGVSLTIAEVDAEA
ncbi:MAG: riboflavin synthase, partial [Phycisphaeraceae bacterium]|nr:riboflavin synthase [Phycisphaeraceae bacterium]